MKSTARAAFGRSATAVILFVYGFVLTQPGRADAAATITAPHRIYGLSNNNEIPVIFTGTDPITMESNVISVVAPIGTGSNTDCTPTIEENWAASGCSAVTLTATGSHGKLRLPGNVFTDNADPLKAVVKSAGGAIVDTSLDDMGGDSFIFHFYGTQDQLNDTLAVLQWIPDKTNEVDMDTPPYEYTGSNPETLQITAVPGDGSGNADPWTVEIRMEGINAWPDLTVPSGPFDVVAGTADGYVSMTGDNLGDFDPPPDFFVTDEDVEQGETGDKILLAMVATCGEFHLLGSQLGFSDEINDILVNELSLPQLAVDAIIAILPEEITSATFGTGDPSDWHTAYAAAGDLDDVQYTLSQVTFRDTTDNETCELFTFVTDLGNNGLPLQYVYITPPGDFEIPFPGFDFGITTFKVGAGTTIDVSLPPTLTINEAASGDAPIMVTPAEHPAFDVSVSTADIDATGGADYTTVTSLSIPIPEDANPTDVVLATLTDMDIEGPETFTLTVTPPVPPPPGFTITTSNATTTVTIVDDDFDTTAPTVTIDRAAGQADSTSASTIVFAVVFSEPVTGFDITDVSLAGSTVGGVLTAAVAGSGADWTVSVTGMTTDGVVQADVATGAANDSALNPSAAVTVIDNTVSWVQPVDDVTQPTVTINQAGAQADPTSTAPIGFTAVFDEPVIGFDASDISFAGSTAGGVLAATVTGGPSVFAVSVTGMTTDGDVVASIPLGAAADLALNLNEASTSTDNTVSWVQPVNDVTPPSVTIDRASGQADSTSASPVVFAVVFSEPVTGFDITDVSLVGSTVAGVLTAAVAGSGTDWTVSVTGMTTDGVVQADIANGAAQDSALNDSAPVVVLDNTVTWVQPPPLTLTVPANIVRPNDPGQAGAIVTYPAATAAGGVPPITVGCNRQSGTFFPLGTTTVTCAATDSGGPSVESFVGRAEATATAAFTITVNDTEPPVIADNPDITTGATGSSTPVTFALPSASDNSGLAPTVACSPASGAGFGIGASVVTCTATDQAGNTAMSDFTVTVTSAGQLPPTGTDPGGQPPPTGTSPGGQLPPTGTSPGGQLPPTGTSPGGQLPVTGTDPGTWLINALLLVAVGIIICVANRRRRARS